MLFMVSATMWQRTKLKRTLAEAIHTNYTQAGSRQDYVQEQLQEASLLAIIEAFQLKFYSIVN